MPEINVAFSRAFPLFLAVSQATSRPLLCVILAVCTTEHGAGLHHLQTKGKKKNALVIA